MKIYGIYIAYSPTVDLRSEGLGRLLAEFLKAANDREDVRFVIACPSWSRSSLQELFDDARIPSSGFEIIGPERKPVLLRLYEFYKDLKRTERKRRRTRVHFRLQDIFKQFFAGLIQLLVTTRSNLFLSLIVVLASPFWIVGSVAYFAWSFFSLARFAVARLSRSKIERASYLANKIRMKRGSKGTLLLRRIFHFMADAESKLIIDAANARKDVRCWYSPTAFWPQFNKIRAPRLICVPDVLLADFPVAFSSEKFGALENFRSVEDTIRGGAQFVTYSNDIKYRTLVNRFRVDPDSVTVVRHGANRLDSQITISGFPDIEVAINGFCANLLRGSMEKAIDISRGARFYDSETKFIFYASQFRPNKNVISLLRAYDHLLKRRYIGHKLVLTGNPHILPEISRFIQEHNLQNDILCLRGLSAQELAACYRMADLAVNPSLSEGGCPFSLTEALSVGTPVVMAKISVTTEVVTDPDLQELMLFNPYNWEAISEKIEWALQNKEALLDRQMNLYGKLKERTWRNVVDEHIEILDRISSERAERR